MNVITVIQPYAHLIALPESEKYHKRVENRSWALPVSLLGKPLAIHAAKARRYGGEAVEDIAEDYGVDGRDLVFGAILAVSIPMGLARIDIFPERRVEVVWGEVPEWVRMHRHSEGPFGLVLSQIRPLPEPLPWKGQQGIWQVPDEAIVQAIADGTPELRMAGVEDLG